MIARARVRRAATAALRSVVPVLLLVLAAAALVGGTASPAAAHASLIGTDPAEGAVLEDSPGIVALTFSESVALPTEAVTVFDSAGETVDSAAAGGGAEVRVRLPETLDEGTYVVSWRVISGDGHPIAGALTFSVGRPSSVTESPPTPPTSSTVTTSVLSIAQGLAYLGALLAAGLLAFGVLVLPRHPASAPIRQRLALPFRLGIAVAVVAGLLVVPLSAAYRLGLDLSDLASSAIWSPGLVHDPLLVVLLVAAGLSVAAPLAGRAASSVRARAVVLAGAGLAASAPVLVGHSRAHQPALWVWVGDIVHLLAAATWLGGLAGLAVAIPRLARRERLAAETLARFSTYAGGLVLALVLTGSFLAWRILGSWSGLVETTYGRLLLVKAGLALVVVAIAAWNRLVLLPRVEGAAGHRDRQRPAGLVARTAAAEAGVLLVVVMVTGFLVNTSPTGEHAEHMVHSGHTAPSTESGSPAPSARPGRSYSVVAPLDDELRVVAVLTPGTRGPNQLEIRVQTRAGDPVDAYDPPVVTLRSEAVDLGTVDLSGSGPGTWSGDVLLPSAGEWRVQVSQRTGDFENPVATVRFTVR